METTLVLAIIVLVVGHLAAKSKPNEPTAQLVHYQDQVDEWKDFKQLPLSHSFFAEAESRKRNRWPS